MKSEHRVIVNTILCMIIGVTLIGFSTAHYLKPKNYPRVYKTEATVLKVRSVPGESNLVKIILDKDFKIFMERKDAWDINQNDVFVVYTDIKNKIKGITIEQHPKN